MPPFSLLDANKLGRTRDRLPAASSRILAHSSTALEPRARKTYRAPVPNRRLADGPALPADAGHPDAATRAAALCAELAALVERRTGSDGGHETAIPELTFWRFSAPTEPV